MIKPTGLSSAHLKLPQQVLLLAFLLGLAAVGPPEAAVASSGLTGRSNQDFSGKEQPVSSVAYYELQRTVLLPAADAYVGGGDNADANFGDVPHLTVRRSPAAGSREAFLRFNLVGITANITSARLNLVPLSVGTGDFIAHQAATVSDNAWVEHNISWNAMPDSGAVVGSWRPVAGKTVSVDVTPQVQAAIRAGSQLSIRVYSLVDVGPDGWVHYGAREGNSIARPRLVLNNVSGLYPSAAGGAAWDSRLWNNGEVRAIIQNGDEYDPTRWSRKRGIGELEVDGRGVLTMRGEQPRMYLDGVPDQFWKNVEVTVYYKRVKDDGTPWGGAVIGARSGPEGHTSEAPCTATTYYSRLRHDGGADFYKELKYPEGEERAWTEAWDGQPLPHDRWIGIKFVVYNLANERQVKLELYRDLTEGKNGGQWEKLLEYTDSGGWGQAKDCPYTGDHIITRGGGVVFIRNTGVEEAQYKWFSVREIVPPQ